MIKGFLIKKKDSIRKFRENGKAIAATICSAQPCVVFDLINQDKSGYRAVALAAGAKKGLNKALAAKMKKAKLDNAPAIVREVSFDSEEMPKIGDKITIDQVITEGDIVDIVGVSKGRGFAGVIKRWGFHSMPATHGQKNRERTTGSIGAQTPGKVIKGKKMPGHYGNVRVTVQKLEVLAVDSKNNQILIKGAVPGFKNGWLIISPVGKVKDFSPLIGKVNKDLDEKENGKKKS